MNAEELYHRMDTDFVLPNMTDEWAVFMDPISDFLCASFKANSIGLVCDFSPEILEVRTAVFPSEKVMGKMLDDGLRRSLLFLHHPSIWDLRKAPRVFTLMERDLLARFKERQISIFAYHVPLDHFGRYSTGVTLSNALGITKQTAFSPYCGGLAGVVGETQDTELSALQKRLENAVGHRTRLYPYGDPAIKGNKVAVVAGGENSLGVLQDLVEQDVNCFVTGVSVLNDFTKDAHAFAREHGINILGGTHYSTEAFACQSMTGYFETLGLPARFIEGEAMMEDL